MNQVCNIFDSELLRVIIALGPDNNEEKVVLSKIHFTEMAEDLLAGRIVSINGKQIRAIFHPSFDENPIDHSIFVGGVKSVTVNSSEISFNNCKYRNNSTGNICKDTMAALKLLNSYYPDYYVDCFNKGCVHEDIPNGVIIKEKDRKIAIISRHNYIIGVKYLYETSYNIPAIIEDEYLWNDFLQRTGHFIITGIYNYPEGLCLSYEMLINLTTNAEHFEPESESRKRQLYKYAQYYRSIDNYMNFDVEKINGMSELEFCGFTAGTLFLTNDEREKIGSTAMSSGLVKAKQLAQFFILQHRIYQTFPNESYDLADLVERYNIY